MTVMELVGLFGGIMSAVGGVFMLLLRYTLALKEKESERRLGELEAKDKKCAEEQAAHSERLRKDELETSDLKGKIALLEQSQTNLKATMERYANDHVPRAEWERQMMHMQRQLDGIITRLDRSTTGPSGRYGGSSHDSGGYPPVKK